MVTFDDCECVSRLLSNTISMLCRNALKYKKELRVEGILGVTLDSDVIFLVRVNETIAALSSGNDSNEPNTSGGIAFASGASTNKSSAGKTTRLPCRPPVARRLALMPKPVSPATDKSPQRSSATLAWPLKSEAVSTNEQMAQLPAVVRSPRSNLGSGTALVPRGRFLPITGPRFSLGRPRLMVAGTRPRGIQATSRMGLRQRMSVPRASMQRLPIRGKPPLAPRSMSVRTGNMLAIRMSPKAQPARQMLTSRAQLAVAVCQSSPRKPTPSQGQLAIEQSPRFQSEGKIPGQMAIVQSHTGQGSMRNQMPSGQGNIQGTPVAQSPKGQGNMQIQSSTKSPRFQGNIQGMPFAQSPTGQGIFSAQPLRGQGNVHLAVAQSLRGQGISIAQSPRGLGISSAQPPRGQGNVKIVIAQSPKNQGNMQRIPFAQSPRGQGNMQGIPFTQSPGGQGNMQVTSIAQSPRGQGNMQITSIAQSPRGQGNMQVTSIAQSPRGQGNMQGIPFTQSPRGQGSMQVTSIAQSPRGQGNMQGIPFTQSPRGQGNMQVTSIAQSPRGQGNMQGIPFAQSPRGQGIPFAQSSMGQGNMQGQIPFEQLPAQLLREVADSQLSRLLEGQNVRQMAVDQISSKACKPDKQLLPPNVQQGSHSVEQQVFHKPVEHVANKHILAVSQPPSSYLMTQMSPGLVRFSTSQVMSSGSWSQPSSVTSFQVRPADSRPVESSSIVHSTQQLQHTIMSNPAVAALMLGSLSTAHARPVLSGPSFQVAPVSHGISRHPMVSSEPASSQNVNQSLLMGPSRAVFESASPHSYRQLEPNLHSTALGLKSHHQSNAEQLRLAVTSEYQYCRPVEKQSSMGDQIPLQTRPSISQQSDRQVHHSAMLPPINQPMPSGFHNVIAQQVLKSPIDRLLVAPDSSRLQERPARDQVVQLSEMLAVPDFWGNQNKDTETFVQQLHELNASEDQYEGWINQFMSKHISPPAPAPQQYQPQSNNSSEVFEAASQKQTVHQLHEQVVSSQSGGPTGLQSTSKVSGKPSVSNTSLCSTTITADRPTATSTSDSSAIVCSTALSSRSAGCSTPDEYSMEKELNSIHGQIECDEDSLSSDSTLISGWCDLDLDLEPEASIALVMSDDSSTNCNGANTNSLSKLTLTGLHHGTLACRLSSSSTDTKNRYTCKARGCNESFAVLDQLSAHYVDSHECDWGPPKDRLGRRIYEQWFLQLSKSTARSSGFSCDQCQRKFFSSSGLRRHRETVHNSVRRRRRKHDMGIA